MGRKVELANDARNMMMLAVQRPQIGVTGKALASQDLQLSYKPAQEHMIVVCTNSG